MSWFRRYTRKSPIIICLLCTALVAGLYYFEEVIDRLFIRPIEPLLERVRDFKPLHSTEFYLQDSFAQYFGRRAKVRPELVYLAIDRDSIQLDQFDPPIVEGSPALSLMKQGWPFSRAIYPMILKRLIDAGAKMVVMDLMFPTPREGDDAFHEALDKYRDHVLFGINFVQGTREGETNTLQMPASDLIQPTSPLDDRVGYVNFWPDKYDQVVRRAHYQTTMADVFGDLPEAGDEVLFSLSAMVLRKSGNGNLIPPPGPHRIRFAGPANTFKPKSLCDIFDEKKWNIPQQYDGGRFFKDKIVLVGPEGNFMKDTVRTPFGVMPGPEVHLNAMNAALEGQFVFENSTRASFLLIAFAGVIAWLLCVEFPAPLLRLGLIAAAIMAWLVVAQLFYNYASFYIFTLNPLIALCSSGVVSLSWDFFMERREKARIRGKFERYVSKQIVKEIVDNPASYLNTLGGERKPIAALFSDLRGFTSMTEEATDSHALVKQLNEYFDVMVEPIIASNGCLDKFIGDAIMAVWGNIQSRGPAQDVRDAVTAALRMRESLPVLNERWVADGKKALKIGIGINYGEAIVGELGSKKHQMNVTAIGDIVNLASRIEGVTKEYAIDLLVGEDAAHLVGDFFYMQVAGLVQVKGRKQPVKLYYVIAERAEKLDATLLEYIRVYDEGIAFYMHGKFAEAGMKFKEALELHPPDKLARVYIERCAVMEKEPVPAGWDGVFVMTKK